MFKRLILYTLSLVVVAGCESKPEDKTVTPEPTSRPPLATTLLLKEPIEAALVETATAALPAWRQAKEEQPTLILLSNNPFLQTIHPSLQAEATRLTLSGDQAEIDQKAVYQSANPTLMPSMAVSAALRANLITKVVWVLPIPQAKPMASAQTLQSQLLSVGDISQEEASTLQQDGKTLAGNIRDTPWTICRINSLPEVAGPVVLHIDLTYFSSLYDNEIKTPLYAILGEVSNQIRDANWKTISATVSASNVSRDISLKTRFLAQDIVNLFAKPELMDAEMPELWRQRSQALYLDNLFQQERIRDIYLKLEKSFPDDASVKYGLFDILGQLKEGEQALHYLENAVDLDRVYALEYLDLAVRAAQKGRADIALKMLNKASDAFPDNPFITLKKIGIYRETGELNHAREMITNLRRLTWSPVYDPNMHDFLKELDLEAKQPRKEAVQ